MDAEKIKQLQIAPERKQRASSAAWIIFLLVLVLAAATAFFALPRAGDDQRVASGAEKGRIIPATRPAATTNSAAGNSNVPGAEYALTVSGYIIARERIELSPRFMGVVKWIGVKKGDTVKRGQVVVTLDDAEYKARVAEADARIVSAQAAVVTARVGVPESEARRAQAEARLASTRANLAKAELDSQRAAALVRDGAESRQFGDDARLRLDAAKAAMNEAEAGLNAARLAPQEAAARLESAQAGAREAEAARQLAQLYLDWTVIRSPIDGVVLEKLVDPDELVVPQSFGGGRGPSTALLALGDLGHLQVEIDLNEADLAKVFRGQRCRVTPEAYPQRHYEGLVVEIAPEAVRQKGTLQVKVEITGSDRYLTPELSARVDFLAATKSTEPLPVRD